MKKQNIIKTPDCKTEVCIGKTVLIVSGFYKKDAKETAIDKMARIFKNKNY